MKHFATLVVICLVAVTTGWGQDCFGEAKFAFWGNNPVVISFTEIQTATFAAVNQDSAVLQFVASNPSGTNLVSASIYLTDKMTAVEAQTAGYQILCQDCDYYLVASGSFANWVTNGITYPIANYSNMLIEVGDRNADSVMDVAGWPVFEHYSGSGQDLGNFDFFVQCTNWSNCVVDYVSVSDTICQGEVYLFGGQLLDSVGIYQDTLENESGCDSVIELTLCMWIPDTTLVADTTCNPTSAGVFTQIFPGLSNGCDSIVITTVELMPGGGDTTITVTKFVCDVAAVDTTVQVLTTASGCDSTVTTITTLYPGAGDTTFVELQSCHVEDVGIAVETLTSQHGCDSIVVIATTLVGVDTTYASATDCDTSQVGTQIEVLTNQSGCDSVLITEVTFEPSTTTFETSTTCYQDSVGIDSLLVNDGAGCFYLQVTEVTFEPSSITYDSTTTCNLDSVTVDSVLIPDASGCLSLLVTSVV